MVSVEVAISRGGEVEVCMTRLSMRTKRSLQYQICGSVVKENPNCGKQKLRKASQNRSQHGFDEQRGTRYRKLERFSIQIQSRFFQLYYYPLDGESELDTSSSPIANTHSMRQSWIILTSQALFVC